MAKIVTLPQIVKYVQSPPNPGPSESALDIAIDAMQKIQEILGKPCECYRLSSHSELTQESTNNADSGKP